MMCLLIRRLIVAPEDHDDLLDQVSPKHYQQFRQLYNELLGYVERDEWDKVAQFSDRLDQSLQQAMAVQIAIDRRLQNFKRQRNIAQKQAIYQRFRNPESTIEISHPFPLKRSIVMSSSSAKDLERVPDRLARARKLDRLQQEMHAYVKDQNIDATVDSMQKPSTKISDILDQPEPTKRSAIERSGDVPDEPAVAPEGVSIRDELVDESIYLKKQRSKDVKRSKKGSKAKPQSASNDGSSKALPADQSRKARIWDYIDKDQSSGGIDHDL